METASKHLRIQIILSGEEFSYIRIYIVKCVHEKSGGVSFIHSLYFICFLLSCLQLETIHTHIHTHIYRCIGFKGHSLACGDFGGHVHVWDVSVLEDSSRVLIKNHRHFHAAHKGHVVCLQIDAYRVVTGSRDKTALVQDFWAKMVDYSKRRHQQHQHQKGGGAIRKSRFLRH